jgi:hypothetical protein
MRLTEAICIIDDLINNNQCPLIYQGLSRKQVTFIQYEDGSGHKFNYSVDNENKINYIDLGPWVEKNDAVKEIQKWLPYLFNDTSEMGRTWAKVRINQACQKLISNQ